MEKNDNPSAFKNFINEKTVEKYGTRIQSFNKSFSKQIFSKNLKSLHDLELKARVRLIAAELHRQLPSTDKKSFESLKKLMSQFDWSGFELWPVGDYLGSFGHQHFELSLNLMTTLTEKFTSEFAIRSYLIKNPEKTYAYLMKMTQSSNVHHRRWASEGSRPRLPWGEKLADAIQNPREGLKILEKLKADSELYVRKSVANHLNDISKDHPGLVIQTLKAWQKDEIPHFDFIKRQALRTLIKKGDPAALKLMGFGLQDKYEIERFKLSKSKIKMNQDLEFSFEIKNPSKKNITINIDYVLLLKKSNGTLAPKVFKLKVIKLKPNESLKVLKKHKIKLITTRKYYFGTQKIALLVNGQTLNEKKWELYL